MSSKRLATDPLRSRDEARRWYAALSGPAVSMEALGEFNRWRRDPGNRAAYDRLARAREGWPVRVRLGSPFLWMAALAVVALAFAAGRFSP